MITYNRRVYVKLRKNYRLEVRCYFAIIFYLMKHTYSPSYCDVLIDFSFHSVSDPIRKHMTLAYYMFTVDVQINT